MPNDADANAAGIDPSADYLEDEGMDQEPELDLEQVMTDVRQMVTRHPGAVLLTAVAAGFLLARALSRN